MENYSDTLLIKNLRVYLGTIVPALNSLSLSKVSHCNIQEKRIELEHHVQLLCLAVGSITQACEPTLDSQLIKYDISEIRVTTDSTHELSITYPYAQRINIALSILSSLITPTPSKRDTEELPLSA